MKGPGVRCGRSVSAKAEIDPELKLPPALENEVLRLKMAPDNTLRHQQLLFFAKEAEPMDRKHFRPENKVPGCLSSVWVTAEQKDDGKIYFKGDSDAMITKGLVTLLVRGLSGATAQEIVAVKPEFIKEAGITASLTPGRNNGFLNMLQVMKKKAVGAYKAAKAEAEAAN
eukprot:CAMPEP_0197526050 /NCGR_PEP_ID=MMETSP1318-20131121/16006_1 /TAXON_ID=552666 /ORGANISM="Partenskyella glossopodia, Strain RCC365" /LENGTH=169 /DNA_ID=CAMNT_0043079991 /DNA_START=143 /DNA_END=652 /DNA_ORIENTATION=-